MIAARNNFLSGCPAPTNDWQMLGATADLAGVGFFNPVKTTMGALKNGAELRPLLSVIISQGCGHFLSKPERASSSRSTSSFVLCIAIEKRISMSSLIGIAT